MCHSLTGARFAAAAAAAHPNQICIGTVFLPQLKIFLSSLCVCGGVDKYQQLRMK